jgi:copper(I)-binding protein
MSMEAVGSIEIPPHDMVILKPGTMHVMLMHLKKQLKRGSTFPLVLQFEKAGRVELTVPIFGPGASGP